MYKKHFITLLLLAILHTSTSDPSPPYWGGHPQFSVSVTYNVSGVKYSADYYYDADQHAERYEYLAGQQDQMCLQSGFDDLKQKRCNVIYASDGYSYMQFPDDGRCCQCTNQFGAVKYDWLQTGASYLGRKTINGVEVDEWGKQGDSRNGWNINHYLATADNQTIFMFYEEKTGHFKQLIYDITTYRNGGDSSKFAPPDNCSNKCTGWACSHVYQ